MFIISFRINWMSDNDVTLVLTKSVKSQKGHVTVPQQQPTGYFSSTVQCPINFNPFSTSFFVWSNLFIITKHELQWVGISCCSLCTRLIRSSCCAELCSRGWAELGNLKEISCVPIILFFFCGSNSMILLKINSPLNIKAPPPHEIWLTWTRTNITGGSASATQIWLAAP